MADRHSRVPFGFPEAQDFRSACAVLAQGYGIGLQLRSARAIVKSTGADPGRIPADGLRSGIPPCPLTAKPFEVGADHLASEGLPHPLPHFRTASWPLKISPDWPHDGVVE